MIDFQPIVLAQLDRLFARDGLKELLSRPIASLMTWLVIGIALALPMILYIMLENASMVSGDWGGKPRVSLYRNGLMILKKLNKPEQYDALLIEARKTYPQETFWDKYERVTQSSAIE